MWKPSVCISRATRRSRNSAPPITTATAFSTVARNSTHHARATRRQTYPLYHLRCFHDYFITHIPSTSLHPDSRTAAGPHHKLPRDKSIPHDGQGTPAATIAPSSRDMTVVRIPLKSAKHHFGVSLSRGTRPYNEDAFQAGTIEIPAFAKRRPVSLTRSANGVVNGSDITPAGSASGDPQVFYFGVFDGHGGSECSGFLREQLHTYVEEAARLFELESSLKRRGGQGRWPTSLQDPETKKKEKKKSIEDAEREALDAVKMHTPREVKPLKPEDKPKSGLESKGKPALGDPPLRQSQSVRKAEELEMNLTRDWKELVGGYFRRFKPEHFSMAAGGRGHPHEKDVVARQTSPNSPISDSTKEGMGIETVLEYAFLKADYDFVSAQVGKQDEDPVLADKAINDDDILGHPSRSGKAIGGPKRFKGGSTCSIALISTPTPTPFWNPSSPSTLITAHVGDTRILLCRTDTGLAVPLTTNHHPSMPEEATRLRRYAAAFVTDSFGEERVSGLANTRSFGDMASKRIGVSAEPEIRRIELHPAEYSFLVLVSDGVSGALSDQEIVDIVKEAKTPEQAARDVTAFATEVSTDADNATTLVVRLGGWERRSEGGLGSLGTKELRDWRKQEAENPRGRGGRM
ncbi:protein serine/threonine phosphatase 2C [Westerdykella ornata]|uniref:Protein serine/threonine phosphatase 2C n=1 Tax=Westerdykella ornata TaxID=318751 RepID=A0A6A6JM17_WESOR|nr:protein serine/threonine phosphatase 2C [Westerdykella ornata]KAF2277275.1 protein serine/threonine phosphatase 2C [Westerdykella ornata]